MVAAAGRRAPSGGTAAPLGENGFAAGRGSRMIVTQRKHGGAVVRLNLAAETVADRQRLAVILADLGLAKVEPADAVVVRGAVAVTVKRQIVLYLRGQSAPRNFHDVADACRLDPKHARAKLWELVATGDVVTVGEGKFAAASDDRTSPVGRTPRRVGRPKNSQAPRGAR